MKTKKIKTNDFFKTFACKKIITVFLMTFLNISIGNAFIIQTFMIDLTSTSRDFVYKIETDKFDQVILDCSSFITGLVFYNNNKEIYNFYLDGNQCQEMYDFLHESKFLNKPVCFEIEHQQKQLTISRKDKMECQ